MSLIFSVFTLTNFAQMDSINIPLEPPDPGTKGGITFIRTTMIDTLTDFYLKLGDRETVNRES